MPGFLLQLGATVTCSHGGQAMPTSPNPAVLVGGQPTATIAGPWVVAGCPLVPPAPGPCVTATWVVGTVRVTSNGQSLVVQSGVAVCVPSGMPLIPVAAQARVSAM
jgi:hypothetical protein